MELSKNKQKEKEWVKLIKDECIAKDWKFKGWFAYKEIDNLFFELNFYVAGKINSMQVSFSFKPMSVDNIFWEITDLSDNKKMPISFRGNGAFVVGSKNIYHLNIPIEEASFKQDIENILDTANTKIAELSTSITDINKFVGYLKQNPDAKDEWFDSDLLIVSYIVQKNYYDAINLLNYAKETKKSCRWGFGDKNFYDLAIEYCQNNR